MGIRNDNKASLHSYYRLRSYKNPPKSNQFDNGEAKFIIEGMVQREGMKEGEFLARARLERSLKVEAAVLKNNAKDWAILYAKNYDLGQTSYRWKRINNLANSARNSQRYCQKMWLSKFS